MVRTTVLQLLLAYATLRVRATFQLAYVKPSNTDSADQFGYAVSVSGNTLVVGATGEDSCAKGINGDGWDNGCSDEGAAYVFARNETTGQWAQQAYVKPSNTGGTADSFGFAVSVSGNMLVVGATSEDSCATGINGNGADNGCSGAGAAYVFARNETTGQWAQQAYVKASNTDSADQFGYAVSVSGNMLVVGAPGEKSCATGINGNGSDNGCSDAGAAYVFARNETTGQWAQQAYIKASNTDSGGDSFGSAVSVSGNTLVVGARGENSCARQINGNGADNGCSRAGAAYVFARNDQTGQWAQQAYLKPSNTGSFGYFGYAVSVSGNMLVVGALGENSCATGINGNGVPSSSCSGSGAAYVFARNEQTGQWAQQAYIKPSNTGYGDNFGRAVSVSGNTLVVGAHNENSCATGINGNGADNNCPDAGAAYVFARNETTGQWAQQAYVKASNTDSADQFGHAVSVSGNTLVVGALNENSCAMGINGDGANNGCSVAGAAYIFYETPSLSVTASQSATSSVSVTASQSATSSVSVTASQSATSSVSVTPSQSATSSVSVTASQSLSETVAASQSATSSVSVTPSQSATSSVSVTASQFLSETVAASQSATSSRLPAWVIVIAVSCSLLALLIGLGLYTGRLFALVNACCDVDKANPRQLGRRLRRVSQHVKVSSRGSTPETFNPASDVQLVLDLPSSLARDNQPLQRSSPTWQPPSLEMARKDADIERLHRQINSSCSLSAENSPASPVSHSALSPASGSNAAVSSGQSQKDFPVPADAHVYTWKEQVFVTRKRAFFLARGASGKVYFGHLVLRGQTKPIAFKMMEDDADSDDEDTADDAAVRTLVKQAIANELKYAQKLMHPNIVRVYGACLRPLGLVMKFCNGGGLNSWLWTMNEQKFSRVDSTRDLTTEERIRCITHLLQGLKFLHYKNAVHGDLKSLNILVHDRNYSDAEMGAKAEEARVLQPPDKRNLQFLLSDFGSVQTMKSTIASSLLASSSKSIAMTGGTLRWNAPERLEPSYKPAFPSDVYSAACVMAEVLLCLPPYPNINESSTLALLNAIGDPHQAPYSEQLLKENQVPPAMIKMMQACWAAAPRSRPTVADLEEQLWPQVLKELKAVASEKSGWKCKEHNIANHDVFVNYRVKSESDTAFKFTSFLERESRQHGGHDLLKVFLDQKCLNNGEDWEVGFLNGLKNAALIVLLISEDGIQGIKQAHKWQDNVLLEYEMALDMMERKEARILPVFLGSNVGGLYKKFDAFSTADYPDEVHASPKSPKKDTIQGVMKRLFKLQGIFVTDMSAVRHVVPLVLEEARKTLKDLGRM
eukprot:g17195.t1